MNNASQEAVYFALSSIPSGHVITYGQLAKRSGLINGARQVGRILRELPKNSNLPWHRVVNAQGKISLPLHSNAYSEQRHRLQAEGIEIKNGRINLISYGCNT